MEGTETKICRKCGKELPVECFVFKDKSKGKRCSRCKDCCNEDKRASYRKHYEQNKEKFKQRKKAFNDIRRSFINDVKSCGCKICGETDVACLDFHHLDSKEYSIGTKLNWYSEEDLQKEIDKCIVICANCHRKLHYYNLTLKELKQLNSVPIAA